MQQLAAQAYIMRGMAHCKEISVTTRPLLYVLLTAGPLLLGCSGESGGSGPSEMAADADQPAAQAPASTDSNGMSAMPRSAAPAGASLYFVDLEDGATVQSPLTVSFGLDGMDVVPAGTRAPQSGHHHIIIDAELPPMNLPIPADANHVHFGDGSTSTTLELAPGEHTLQLLLGDHLHIPHQPPVTSERITIAVE